jgi:hypothetical protein
MTGGVRDAAVERRYIKRQAAAAKGAVTRERRHSLHVDQIARALTEGHVFGPLPRCICCKRWLSEAESVNRGIGPECWQMVLSRFEAIRGAAV